MARKPDLYESRLMAALLLRGGEAHESELVGVFDRVEYLRRASEGLAQCGAVVVDRQQARLRLLSGRAMELLGLARTPAVQTEAFSEGCLLPAVGVCGESVGRSGGPPQGVAHAAPGAACGTTSTYTRDRVLEFSELEPRVLGGGNLPLGNRGQELGASDGETRLGGEPLRAIMLNPPMEGRAKARYEQRVTEKAQLVASRFRADGYLMDKLEPRRKLREELMEGQTPTARKFAVLYQSDPDRARELLGLAVLANNPPANLNVRLQSEGVRY